MQNYEQKNRAIEKRFAALADPAPLRLSWSNWGFGLEPLADSLSRLARHGFEYVELHGNHYGPDLGYRVDETRGLLSAHGLKVSGLCGMFSPENDLSSPSGRIRQAAIDYIKREIDFAHDIGASYLLVVPGAVGRPVPCDDYEFDRSVDSLRRVADRFVQAGVRAAVEPIRADEVSFCHTVADARRYLAAVDHPGVRHINGDVYHMQSGEAHIGEAVLSAGRQLANLHVADSNRAELGGGSLDFATLIRALHLLRADGADFFVTAEPLGPGGDPHQALHGRPSPELLDGLVGRSAAYFRALEREVASARR